LTAEESLSFGLIDHVYEKRDEAEAGDKKD
jgi:ATP-dependent protease ClpP protease subunit